MSDNIMSDNGSINIEVVYGTPEKQLILEVLVDSNATVEQTIEISGMSQHFPEIDLSENKVGIWNRTCKLTDTLKDGDRIEIYRPLIADPKEVRRMRAEKAKEEGRADKVTGGRAKASKRNVEKNDPASQDNSDA
jgi:putative ubiquitin-RnfH superfamily antitoxin RatB of RatAB toxin-antitoxin module